NLTFVDNAAEASKGAEFHYLCVPTPAREDGSANTSYLEAAIKSIAPVLQTDCIVVNKSTVPVGSASVVADALQRPDIAVVSNPEFLREGSAVHDFLNPDRVVVGAEDEAAAAKVGALYSRLNAPVLITDPVSAETIKYASNAFLASKLSFINAIANLCEAVGADVGDVVAGMGYDSRIGRDYLSPGPGWGGSCFPKDTEALTRIAEAAGYDFRFLKEVIKANEEQYERTAQKVISAGGDQGGHVAILGLTFKAGTDDLRNSPSIEVVSQIVDAGLNVRAYDPTVEDDKRLGALEGKITVCPDPYSAAEGASVLAIMTEWDEFKWLDFDKVGEIMASKKIVDGRNHLDPVMIRRRGFEYQGVGL
ncbi:UNVERIFIED_CONTAM: hypothetical protein GTU68_005683, partial [Idotea baltica]|nr:hypothetical protein [Idotea baltica]